MSENDDRMFERGNFEKSINYLPIKNGMTALAWICENYFGRDSEYVSINTSTKQAEADGILFLNDFFRGGNFSKNCEAISELDRDDGINKNFNVYITYARRLARLGKLCPSEA